jgi:hypothetical protein
MSSSAVPLTYTTASWLFDARPADIGLSADVESLRLGRAGKAGRSLVWCAALFCTYLETVAKTALARVTLAKMSEALAVQIKGLGLRLC